MSGTGAQFIIGDVDRTDFVRDEAQCNFNVTSQQPGLCTLQLVFPPEVDPFVVGFDNHFEIFETFEDSDPARVYVGLVEDLAVGFLDDSGWHTITISVASLEKMLDGILVPESDYSQTAAGTIVTTLMSNASSEFKRGVGIGTVNAGATVNRTYDGKTSLWQALTQLATDSGYVVYIDPADVALYFHDRTARVSDFTITSPDILKNQDGSSTIAWKQSKSDFRNKQSIQLANLSLPPESEVFAGDGGTTQFTLANPAREVIAAGLTTAVGASAIGTFTGQPNDGDTISIISFYSPPIAPPDYTLVAVLDNTVFGQVLIGATDVDTYTNLADAINGNPLTAGIAYSSATFANQQASAKQTGSTIVITAKTLGVQGNTIGLASTAANFSWGSDTLAGGTVGVTTNLSIAVLGASSADFYYTPGTSAVLCQVAPVAGASLQVTYYRPSGSQINGSNNANEDLGIGTQWAMMHPRDVTMPTDAIFQMSGVLAAYSTLPAQVSFETFKTGLQPGKLQLVDVDFPLFAAALINGNWLIQDVQATWISGIENASDPKYRHFRYTPNMINSTEVSNYVDMFQQLFSPTPLPLPPSPVVPPQVVTPGPGTQWVQETLRPVSAVSGTDLVVDGSDNTVVTSASYTFVSGDIGSRLNIGLTTGWTPGEYLITGVTAGAATLNMTPAAVSTTGGHWSLFNGTAYQMTWSPLVSDWTHNQIVILALISGGVTHVLTPFKYDEEGFVIVGPPDPTFGPDYQVTGNNVQLKQATSVGDVLLAVYFPSGLAIIPTTNPHGDDGTVLNPSGDFGRQFQADSFCFDDSAVGKILRIKVSSAAGWDPGDYLITGVGVDSLACVAFLEFNPASGLPFGSGGGVWELIG